MKLSTILLKGETVPNQSVSICLNLIPHQITFLVDKITMPSQYNENYLKYFKMMFIKLSHHIEHSGYALNCTPSIKNRV